MSTRDLSEAEAEAIQLVRRAGFEAKANLLDDMLEEGDIKVEPELPDDIPGRRADFLWPFDDEVQLGPIHFGSPMPYPLKDPRMILLAATLMHEANHVMEHGEIEAWGNTTMFLERLLENIGKYFPGLDETGIEAHRRRIEEEIEVARRKRMEHARGAGRLFQIGTARIPGPSRWRGANGLPGLQESRGRCTASPREDPVSVALDMLGRAIFRFKRSTGDFPGGDARAMVGALRSRGLLDAPLEPLLKLGPTTHLLGGEVVYRQPGTSNPGAFHLSITGQVNGEKVERVFDLRKD